MYIASFVYLILHVAIILFRYLGKASCGPVDGTILTRNSWKLALLMILYRYFRLHSV